MLFVVYDVGDESEGLKELGPFGSYTDCPLLVFIGQGKLRRSANSGLMIRSKDDIRLFVQEVLDNKGQVCNESLSRAYLGAFQVKPPIYPFLPLKPKMHRYMPKINENLPKFQPLPNSFWLRPRLLSFVEQENK